MCSERNPASNGRSVRPRVRMALTGLLCAAMAALGTWFAAPAADAREPAGGPRSLTGGKLLATGGVTQVEGAAGGGLVPWAVIGGYGTEDQIGANAFTSYVRSDDYALTAYGAMIGLYDRVELSLSRQEFDTRDIGAVLGLGEGFTFDQTILGAKVRLFGDAVLDQDTWMPQVSVGVQQKWNHDGDIVRAVGARGRKGTDFYVSATKLLLDYSTLATVNLRMTKANELGILGFGGTDNRYEPQLEANVAYLFSKSLAVGAEYRMKPDNLAIVQEDDWFTLFAAWVPSKNVSLTLAYANLGTVAIADDQDAVYLSLQIGF